jgi:hypothetical protein
MDGEIYIMKYSKKALRCGAECRTFSTPPRMVIISRAAVK